MLTFRFNHTIVILLLIKYLCCQRRISSGKKLKNFKTYLVYFMNSENSTNFYEDWTCAGALVHSLFIVTAAACLQDVQNLYAMAGYAKLIPYESIDVNYCLNDKKTHKKKVIYTCIPKAYELDYANVEKWSSIDIGIAKVDSPFLRYIDYTKICSVKPLRIPINFNPAYQSPGIDAIVMGWGHLKIWRGPADKKNYNQQNARVAQVRIINKAKCKEYYQNFPELQKTIDKYMICTLGKGEVDAEGEITWRNPQFKDTCDGDSCRRNFNESTNWNISNVNGRRQGICQNDHGGPLTTWVGGKEHLIGIASVFRVNQHGDCAGPYLFTSTQCNGVFLSCVLQEHLYKDIEDHRRSPLCKLSARERGFSMIHRYINWGNTTQIKRKSRKGRKNKVKRVTKRDVTHKTAKKNILREKIQIRPQISIRNFNRNVTIFDLK